MPTSRGRSAYRIAPWVPILGILFCLSLMLGLPLITWVRLVVWLVIGLVIYFAYGRRHSRLRHA
jgi:APA family basic amino acid/polyamine antiporter